MDYPLRTDSCRSTKLCQIVNSMYHLYQFSTGGSTNSSQNCTKAAHRTAKKKNKKDQLVKYGFFVVKLDQQYLTTSNKANFYK